LGYCSCHTRLERRYREDGAIGCCCCCLQANSSTAQRDHESKIGDERRYRDAGNHG
jgi:hypothetical protein